MSLFRQIRSSLRRDGILADRVGAPGGSVLAYVLTLLIVAGALMIRTLLQPWLVGAQFITFFPAVMLSTLFLGTAAGLVAIAMSVAAASALLGPGGLSPQEINSLVLFVGVALMDVWIISALLAANAAARDDEARFRQLLEAAPDASVIVDGRHRIILVNAQTEELFGYTRAELVGQQISMLVPARFRAAHAEHIAHYQARPRSRQMGEGRELYGLHQNGSEFPVEVKLSPIRPSRNGLVSCVIRDVTALKVAEERQLLLIHELNHRVKNTLATVQAIASQTLKDATDTKEFGAVFSARLLALSRCHDVLTRHDWSGANVSELVAEQLRPYEGGHRERFVLDGPDVGLTPSAALALGMALGELATNAAKYGALSVDTGAVSVSWAYKRVAGEYRLALTWRESGGPPVHGPASRGFGTRLIERGLIYGLGGTAQLTFGPTGVGCEIEFPLDRRGS